MAKKKKILFIFTEWGVNEWRTKHNAYGGIGYYRIIKPAVALRNTGLYDITIWGKEILSLGKTAEKVWKKIFQEFDMVITKHLDDSSTCSMMIGMSRYYGVPLLVDFDDDFLNLRDDNPASLVYAKGEAKRYYLMTLAQLADGLIVSTNTLSDSYKLLNDRIHVIPNYNDVNDWKFPRANRRENFVIGYAGSITHDDDLATVIPALDKILGDNPKLEFQILGAMYPEQFAEFVSQFKFAKVSQIKVSGGTPSWEGYPELLSKQEWDIGIAPLVDDAFNRSKSHIKWMEYAMCGIPCVASDVKPYSDYIEDGVTGFLAKDWKQFYKKMKKLLKSRKLRDEIAQAAYTKIATDLQYKDHVNEWVNVIEYYLSPTFTKPSLDGIQ